MSDVYESIVAGLQEAIVADILLRKVFILRIIRNTMYNT